jgi:hypothetical protein
MTTHSPLDRIQHAYDAFVANDAAWQAELTRLFGENAGDVRYTPESKVGTLAPLWAAFVATNNAWYAAIEAMRLGRCVFCEGLPHAKMCASLRALLMDDAPAPSALLDRLVEVAL